MRLRFRTQLLLSMFAVACILTAATLLVVRYSIRSEIEGQAQSGLSESVQAFQQVQREQASELRRTAALIAELPTFKAMMSTEHAPTIQDASAAFWNLSGADLLVLAGSDGQVKAFQAGPGGMSSRPVWALLADSLRRRETVGWWQDGNNLYRVVLQPIIAGSGSDEHALGVVVIGRQMNTEVAHQLGRLAGSDIMLAVGTARVATTLGPEESAAFARLAALHEPSGDVDLAGPPFDVASVELDPGSGTPIRCYVLLPLEPANALLKRINRTIALLGLLGIVGGAGLVVLLSRAITRPLENLVGAVRAFAVGDDTYRLEERGSHDLAELGAAFTRMREQVLESQRKQLEAERLAALGRAASSISHDLRHHLAILVANSEFLREADTLGFNREEIYREVERASGQMTDLIDSLVEVARDQNTLSPADGRLEDVAQRAVDAVHSSPDFRSLNIAVTCQSSTDGRFDGKKIQRAIFNILLNACEATAGRADAKVEIALTGDNGSLECRIRDNGPGVPPAIRANIFEPFVSMGKHNGTGLGLAIASKIVRDHDGELVVEETSGQGTTFLMRIPRRTNGAASAGTASSQAQSGSR